MNKKLFFRYQAQTTPNPIGMEISHAEGSYIFEEGNPAGIKAMLAQIEVCKPYLRLPLVSASDVLAKKIKHEISEFNPLSAQ